MADSPRKTTGDSDPDQPLAFPKPATCSSSTENYPESLSRRRIYFLLYMSRTVKILIALFVIAVLWKVVFSDSSDVDIEEVEYEPAE